MIKVLEGTHLGGIDLFVRSLTTADQRQECAVRITVDGIHPDSYIYYFRVHGDLVVHQATLFTNGYVCEDIPTPPIDTRTPRPPDMR